MREQEKKKFVEENDDKDAVNCDSLTFFMRFYGHLIQLEPLFSDL